MFNLNDLVSLKEDRFCTLYIVAERKVIVFNNNINVFYRLCGKYKKIDWVPEEVLSARRIYYEVPPLYDKNEWRKETPKNLFEFMSEIGISLWALKKIWRRIND